MNSKNIRQQITKNLLLMAIVGLALLFPITPAISSKTASSPVTDHAPAAGHATTSGAHGEEESHSGPLNLGNELLHHLTQLDAFEIPSFTHWTQKISLAGLQFELFGIDLSITKPVVFMWLAGLILILSFALAFRGGKLMRNKYAHLLEVYVLFIRDEVIYPNLGEKDGQRLMPFLLTVFFFILSCNLLGMIPFGMTATSNINVTAGLAIIALIMIQGMGIVQNGFFGHFKAALIPSGLPWPLLIIMIPIEMVGIIAKPFALCIRLFANMVAGHAVILVLLMLILVGGSYLIAPFPVAGVLFISMIELFVAHLQAFIFTILTTLFISMTMHPSH